MQYVTLYYAIIDMTEYNSNGIVFLKMSSEVLTKLGQGMLNCCLYFNLKMLWTRTNLTGVLLQPQMI